MLVNIEALPHAAVGLRLARITKGDDLILCEPMEFKAERAAVQTTLRRASISGMVHVAGPIADHFADVLDANGDLIETVSLDAGSYRMLKTRWMRCRVDRSLL